MRASVSMTHGGRSACVCVGPRADVLPEAVILVSTGTPQATMKPVTRCKLSSPNSTDNAFDSTSHTRVVMGRFAATLRRSHVGLVFGFRHASGSCGSLRFWVCSGAEDDPGFRSSGLSRMVDGPTRGTGQTDRQHSCETVQSRLSSGPKGMSEGVTTPAKKSPVPLLIMRCWHRCSSRAHCETTVW